MSFWKILAGAATGVAGVVALPIAGPIGTITAVGALAAGAVGAAGGAVADALDDSEEQAEERGEKRGEEKERAKHCAQLKKIQEYMRIMLKAVKDLEDCNQFFEKLIAMAAVGFACANCDGEIHHQEIEEIDEFIAGVNHSELPSHVKERLGKLQKEPPNLKTAFKIAKKAKMDPSILDDVIRVVMHADGRVHPNERAFMKTWHKMKSA